mgnify:CR=1 FL=1
MTDVQALKERVFQAIDAHREEIVALQWAVQGELQERSLARVDSESVARA